MAPTKQMFATKIWPSQSLHRFSCTRDQVASFGNNVLLSDRSFGCIVKMRTEDIYCTNWLQIIWSCSNNCCLLPCRPDKCILQLICGGGAQRNDRTLQAHYENGRSQRPFLCLIVLMNPRWAHLPACLCQPAWILQFCIQTWDLIQSFLWPYISWNIFKWSYAQIFILQIFNNAWTLLDQCCNEIFYQS